MRLSFKYKLTTIIPICLFMLSACTQKSQDTFSTVGATIDGLNDVNLTEKELLEFPYDSAYVRLNNGRKILMTLALIEKNHLNSYQHLKWVSADNFMLVTENGRIIKSLGFKHNLTGITSLKNLPQPSTKPNQWNSYYDWMPAYRYHFSAKISSQLINNESISLASWTLDTQHIEESISFIELNTQFINHYWLSLNKEVVKTIQYLGPNMDKIEMTFVKSFLPQTK